MQTSAAAKLQLATKVEASGRRHTRSHSFMQAQMRSSMLSVLVAQYKCTKHTHEQTHEANAHTKRTMRDTLARSDAGVADDERAASASCSSSSTRCLRMSSRQRSLPVHDDLDRAHAAAAAAGRTPPETARRARAASPAAAAAARPASCSSTRRGARPSAPSPTAMQLAQLLVPSEDFECYMRP